MFKLTVIFKTCSGHQKIIVKNLFCYNNTIIQQLPI